MLFRSGWCPWLCGSRCQEHLGEWCALLQSLGDHSLLHNPIRRRPPRGVLPVLIDPVLILPSRLTRVRPWAGPFSRSALAWFGRRQRHALAQALAGATLLLPCLWTCVVFVPQASSIEPPRLKPASRPAQSPQPIGSPLSQQPAAPGSLTSAMVQQLLNQAAEQFSKGDYQIGRAHV